MDSLFEIITSPQSSSATRQCAPIASPGSTLKLHGTVLAIVFSKDDFVVADFQAEEAGDEPIRLVGAMPGLAAGMDLFVLGQWVENSTYGPQLKVREFAMEIPRTKEGLIRYLGSGLVKGIGPALAERIVARFGKEALRVLDETPGKLLAVSGIGPKKLEGIRVSWEEQRKISRLMTLLMELGVGPGLAAKIRKAFGDEAERIVRTQPYRLTEIHGIGFKTADQLAQNLGIGPEDPARLEAGVRYTLEQMMSNEGHTCAPRLVLAGRACEILEVEADLIQAAIGRLLEAKRLRSEEGVVIEEDSSPTEAIYLNWLHQAEMGVAERLRRLTTEPPALNIDLPELSKQIAGITLSERQREAVKSALTRKVVIITGGPGTGKAQPVDSLVLTPQGWRQIGYIKVGDKVTTPDGKVAKVIGVYPQGPQEVFEITFDDGRTARSTKDHLWKIWTRISVWHPEKKKKVRLRGWRVVPLGNIMDWRDKERTEYQRIAVPMVSAMVANIPDREFVIPPYIIGFLLGDGSLNEKSGISFATSDEYILHKLAQEAAGKNYEIKRRGQPEYSGRAKYDYYFYYTPDTWKNPWNQEINRLELRRKSPEKFIPQDYKQGSYNQRVALLQGLMDADGSVGSRTSDVTFSTSSEQLAKDIQELIWSLGGIAQIKPRFKTYTYNGQRRNGLISFQVSIRYMDRELLFSLPRKKSLIPPFDQHQYQNPRLRITDIKSVGIEECVCIAIDHPDQLYVTDNYVVTHNTTVTRSILALLKEAEIKPTLAAPTGRAAKRMAEVCGHEASTIHRLLRATGPNRFDFDEHDPLDTQILFIDEFSMVDVGLFHALLKALPNRTHLVIIGDADQLPSVGPGRLMFDLVESGVLPCVRLDTIFRQAESSSIITNAHRINRGETPLFPQDVAGDGRQDFFFFSAEDPLKANELVVDLVARRIPARFGYQPADVQVLSPLRRKGEAAVDALNRTLQEALNPPGSQPEHRSGGRVFRLGDRVIQTRNNYDAHVFNGEMGAIEAIDAEERRIIVRFEEDRLVEYSFDADLDDLELAYALSIHKSQGSEYRVVVVPMLTAHYIMLRRNLIYTAVTRAREMVVLVGQRKAIALAVSEGRRERRYSGLRHYLASG